MNDIPLKMIEGEFERQDQDTMAPLSDLVLDENGQPKPKMLRVMGADQVKERIELQALRTTQSLRKSFDGYSVVAPPPFRVHEVDGA